MERPRKRRFPRVAAAAAAVLLAAVASALPSTTAHATLPGASNASTARPSSTTTIITNDVDEKRTADGYCVASLNLEWVLQVIEDSASSDAQGPGMYAQAEIYQTRASYNATPPDWVCQGWLERSTDDGQTWTTVGDYHLTHYEAQTIKGYFYWADDGYQARSCAMSKTSPIVCTAAF